MILPDFITGDFCAECGYPYHEGRECVDIHARLAEADDLLEQVDAATEFFTEKLRTSIRAYLLIRRKERP